MEPITGGEARPTRRRLPVARALGAAVAVVSVAAALGYVVGVSLGKESGAVDAARIAPELGATAPDFEAVDGAGQMFRLSDYRGQPVLVNFFATWCVACKAEIPAIQTVLEDHGRDGLVVIAVDQNEDADVAQRFLSDLGAGFRLAVDDGRIGRAYQVVGLPTSFFLDRSGVIRKRYLGEMTLEMVEEFTHLALRPRPAASGLDRESAELLVLLDPSGPGTLYLVSPVIRCGPTFCADGLLQILHSVPAVLEARGVPQGEGGGEDVPIFVRYDPTLGSPQDVVGAFRRALEEKPDPVYGSRLAVRYLSPIPGTPGGD